MAPGRAVHVREHVAVGEADAADLQCVLRAAASGPAARPRPAPTAACAQLPQLKPEQ